MSKIKLNSYRIREIHFENRIPGNVSIELGHKISFQIRYNDDKQECLGKCRIQIEDKKKEQPFHITMEMEGLFNYERGVDKREIHNMIFKELYPYLRVFITTLTANAGMPPLFIPFLDIEVVEPDNSSRRGIIQ